MLSRQATKIALVPDDITEYEQRKADRDAMRKSDLNSSQDSDRSTVENGMSTNEEVLSPAAQAKNKARMTREQRIGVGSSRG